MRPVLCLLSLCAVACQRDTPAAAPAPLASADPAATVASGPPAPASFTPINPAPPAPSAAPEEPVASAAPAPSPAPPPAVARKPRPSPESRGFRLSTGEPKKPGLQIDPFRLMMKGQMPAILIQRVMRQNFGRIRLCYEDGLRRDATLEGRVAIEFTINGDGSVSDVEDGGSYLPDPAVIQCLLGAVRKIAFPEPPRGKAVRVIYPWSLSPGG